MHPDQLQVTTRVAADLIGSQFPQYAELRVTPVRTPGTVNAIFRIGARLAARFPLLPGDVDRVRHRLEREASAARLLLGRTRFPVPEPVEIGEPGGGYPLPWSIQTWLPGVTADAAHASCCRLAHDVAELIRGVRAIDLDGRTFEGEGRGGDFRSHDEWVETCLERSTHLVDVDSLQAIWARLRSLPRAAPDVMTHGDLIPANLLVSGGRLSGVLDVGGLGPADPALDLVAAWHVFDADRRQILRDRLGCDRVAWERGKAWALQQAIGLVWYYVESNPPMSQMGRATLERIVRDEARFRAKCQIAEVLHPVSVELSHDPC